MHQQKTTCRAVWHLDAGVFSRRKTKYKSIIGENKNMYVLIWSYNYSLPLYRWCSAPGNTTASHTSGRKLLNRLRQFGIVVNFRVHKISEFTKLFQYVIATLQLYKLFVINILIPWFFLSDVFTHMPFFDVVDCSRYVICYGNKGKSRWPLGLGKRWTKKCIIRRTAKT